MGEGSKIEWCQHTFNPWIGCQKVSAGCDHCYAETQNNHRKWNGGEWGPHAPRKRTSEGYWKQPLRWNRQAGELGVRPRVFCASLADVFDNKAPDGARTDLFALIEDTPHLDWLLLTKRPENIDDMIWPKWDGGLPRNIWIGTTCEDQKAYDRRWNILQKIPAAVRFISYEPAIGPLRLHLTGPQPHWLICGGESGPGARFMEHAWAGDIQADCAAFGVAFFMKQMTGKKPIPDHLMTREFPA